MQVFHRNLENDVYVNDMSETRIITESKKVLKEDFVNIKIL